MTAIFKEIVYDGLELIANEDPEHEDYNVKFTFGADIEVSLYYSSREFWEDNLTRLPESKFGLGRIKIECYVKNPVETIEKTFEGNPFNYGYLPFDHAEFFSKDFVLPKVREKDNWVIDRLICSYKNGIYSGYFGKIERKQSCSVPKGLKARILHKLRLEEVRQFLGINQVIPFTEKEKIILSNLAEFEVRNRFPRYNKDPHNESKHIFNFKIKKEDELFNLNMDVQEGFTSGFDLESLWMVENLFSYLDSTKMFVPYDEEVKKVYVRVGGYGGGGGIHG